MVFSADNYWDIVKSLAAVFEVSAKEMEKNIKENPFILKQKFDSDYTKIDKVSFYHLTRRLYGDEGLYEGKNLVNMLTRDTLLKQYLQNYGLTFAYENGRIRVFMNGNEIELIDDLSNGFLKIPYLKSRLGYYENSRDFCVNGFLFGDNLKNNDYYRSLLMGPELLFQIANLAGDMDIYYEYRKQSTYYVFKYEIPIDEVIVDGCEKLRNAEKQKLVIKEAIKRIIEYDDLKIGDDNIILRMPDDVNIPSKYFASKQVCED